MTSIYVVVLFADQLTEVSFRVLPHLLTVPPQRGKKNPKLDGSAIEKMFFFDVQVSSSS